jgi:hypothetical protein
MLSLLVTVGLWSLPWVMWPTASVKASGLRRPVPVIRYVRAVEGMEGAAWSPVVFPLPTKDGFSKKAVALESAPGMVSLLKASVPEAVYLQMPPERIEEVDVGLLTVKEDVAFRPQAGPENLLSPVVANRKEGLQVECDEALAKRKFEAPGLQQIQLTAGSPVWITVTAYVELDRLGRVQHVFLDNSCGQTNTDGLIVRALLSGKAAIVAAPVQGRVRLNYWKNAKLNGELKN